MAETKRREILGTDETVKRQVESQLHWDGRINSSDIDVSVSNGHVVLEGSVPSYYSKDAAYDAILMVAGIKSVENNLVVRYPQEQFMSKKEIRESVKSVMRWNPDLDEEKIKVDVEGGHVLLEGSVDAFWKRSMAESDAKAILGVTGVTNKLTVVPKKSIVDESIEEDIERAIERDYILDKDAIDVAVQDGKAILRGTVGSWTEKREAFDIACCTLGVRTVDDQISVAGAA